MNANAEVHEVRVVNIDRESRRVTIEKVKTGVRYKIEMLNNTDWGRVLPGMKLFLAIKHNSMGGPVYSLRFHEEEDERPSELNSSHINQVRKKLDFSKPPKSPTVADIQVLCQYYEINSFYHITHFDNLAGILKDGLLCRNSGSGYTDVSNQDIQEHRHFKRIPIYPNLTLHDFAPLFVAPKPPMLSALREKQSELVYVCFSPNVLSLPWTIFTDGNARNNRTQFFSDLSDFSKLDWKILNAHYWNSDNPEVHAENKRKRSAEVLVREYIRPAYINGIMVSNGRLLSQVREIINGLEFSLPVRCAPEFYYG